MLGEESACEILQIRKIAALLVTPVGCELKTVGISLLMTLLLFLLLLHMGVAGGVTIVFCIRSVADDEDLHVVIQTCSAPKRIILITVDLVESLLDVHTTTFQFDVHQRQTVHQDRHIVTVFVSTPIGLVLVDDLKDIVVDALLVDQTDVLCLSVIEGDIEDFASLYGFGFVLYSLAWVSNLSQQLFPFVVGKNNVVKFLQALTKILHQLFVGSQRLLILIALLLELGDKRQFQFILTLVAGAGTFRRLVFGHDGGVFQLGNDVVLCAH